MHESGHYLLPSEFLLLFAVWLVPPLLIGLGIQFFVLRRNLRVGLVPVFSCFAATVVLSTAGFVAVLFSNSRLLKSLNTALTLPAPYELLLMPVAFVVVALVAGVVGYVFARSVRPA